MYVSFAELGFSLLLAPRDARWLGARILTPHHPLTPRPHPQPSHERSFYTDDAPGLKIGPFTVLVLSLMFIAFVVLLHIWGKLTRG
jgi:hypothetical protein